MKWLEKFRRKPTAIPAGLCDVESFKMNLDKDNIDVEATFSGAAVKAWCFLAVDWFKETGGKNYVTMDMVDSRDGARYTMTMQKAGGRTPAQDLAELRAKS